MTKHKIFVSGNPERTAAAKLAKFAAEPENWYYINDDGTPITPLPGNKKEHQIKLGDTEGIFSWSIYQDKLFRHLSVKMGFGMPLSSALTVAHYLGFTGAQESEGQVLQAPKGWQIATREGQIIIMEELKENYGQHKSRISEYLN